MIFTEIKLKGAFVVELKKNQDARGFFSRTFCRKEFEAQGLDPNIAQANISFNLKKGTLRGMHLQKAPYSESKLVSCARGAIFDVIVDLRVNSSTYRQWAGEELTEDNYKALYIPKGFAHGFMTLKDDTVVSYFMSQFYEPGSEAGFRYDDPAFGISWPIKPVVIADKDKNWPNYV